VASADDGPGPDDWSGDDDVEQHEGTVSLSRLRADDELLSALGRGAEPPGTDELSPGGDELGQLLAEWQASIDSEPVPELVDTDAAMATLAGAKRRAEPHRRRPVLMPVAGAAAGVLVAAGALAGVARSAQPGSSLWNVSRVLYADHARSVMATDSIRQHLQQAQTALRSGHPERARDAMSSISRQLPAVNEGNGKQSLVAQWNALLDQMRIAAPAPAPGPRHAKPAQPDATAPATTRRTTAAPKHSKTETPPPEPPASTSTAEPGAPASTPTEQQKPGSGSSPGPTGNGGATEPPTTQSLPRPSGGSGAAEPSTQAGAPPSTQSGTRGSSQTPGSPEPTPEPSGSASPQPSESSPQQPAQSSTQPPATPAQPSGSSPQSSGGAVADPSVPGGTP
jgi:hypothetical protein